MKQFLFVCTALAALAAGGCATGSAPAESAPNVKKVTFLCDRGQNITVSFTGNKATLDTDTTSVALVQQRAASGISYAGGGHQLRGKGPEMQWTDPAGTVRNCRDQEWAMSQPQIQEPVQGLSGSSWRLVRFQPAGNAAPLVPPNVAGYTLNFMPDGSLAMQLDCNRGTAKWQAGQTTSGGGTLSISPGAMTRAMCGPGAIDTRLAADLGRVRSFTMAGKQLHMTLEGDGGTYVWEPITTPAP